jgi:hypothetical protein
MYIIIDIDIPSGVYYSCEAVMIGKCDSCNMKNEVISIRKPDPQEQMNL